jgi:glutaredoxin-related protein
MIEILNSNQISYGSFDILTDEEIRTSLKLYSDWPTYPQLYVHGDLVGGLDIIKEMITTTSTATLKEQLGVKDHIIVPTVAAHKTSLEDRIKSLINSADVMLFMKGVPTEVVMLLLMLYLL